MPFEPLSEKQALDRIDELREMDKAGLYYDEDGLVCVRKGADPAEHERVRRGLRRHWAREDR